MMHSSFWFGLNISDLLFKDFSFSTNTSVALLCVAVIIFAAIYELARVLLAKAKLYSSALRSSKHPKCISDSTQFIVEDNKSLRKRWSSFLLEIFLYIVEVVIAYFIMLLFMTYNGYICISILIGSTIGYLLLGHKMMVLRIKARNLKMPCQHCFGITRNMSVASCSSEAISNNPCTSSTTQLCDIAKAQCS